MRAVIGSIDPGTRLLEQFPEAGLYGPILRLPEVASPDPGLIRHHDDGKPCFIQPGDRVCRAREELDAGRVSEISPILDDRAIAIEEDRRATLDGQAGQPAVTWKPVST